MCLLSGWDREIRTPEMTGSEPVALPLGYIPTAIFIIHTIQMYAIGNLKKNYISLLQLCFEWRDGNIAQPVQSYRMIVSEQTSEAAYRQQGTASFVFRFWVRRYYEKKLHQKSLFRSAGCSCHGRQQPRGNGGFTGIKQRIRLGIRDGSAVNRTTIYERRNRRRGRHVYGNSQRWDTCSRLLH